MANLILIGAAIQSGQLPLSVAALEQAIRLSGAGVSASLQAFRLGRLVAADTSVVNSVLKPKPRASSLVPYPSSASMLVLS